MLTLLALLWVPVIADAQEQPDTEPFLPPAEAVILEAEVVRVIGTRDETIPQLGLDVETQTIDIQLLEGDDIGDTIQIDNDYIQVEEGDRIFVRRAQNFEGDGYIYGIIEVKRTSALWWLFALFVIVIISFGGWQGVRSLLSLAASLFIILYLLVPALVSGYPPVLTSIGIAVLVLFGAIFITHGFNRRSLAAFVGTIIAISITGFLAWVSVDFVTLTGFGSDESIYLNINTEGTLNFAGLLLGAIIIGVLGVLDDIAITQVAVVQELLKLRAESEKKTSLRDIYTRAMRVGREHVAALVNTLVLAYTGAALPLLLWVSSASTNFMLEANREIFAAEIVRTLIGSIGLIMTVPITTAIAVWLLKDRTKEELDAGEMHACAHGHSQ